MIRNKYLLLTLILSTLLMSQSSIASDSTSKKKRMFSEGNISILCGMIKSFDKENIAKQMDKLIKQGGITKEQWNNKYAFTVNCLGNYPIVYAVKHDLEDFITLAEYGVSLNHPFRDDDQNVTTLKDYLRDKIKTTKGSQKLKFVKMFKYLRKNGGKGCKQMPELKCTATYIK